jgi:hypothetical protein
MTPPSGLDEEQVKPTPINQTGRVQNLLVRCMVVVATGERRVPTGDLSKLVLLKIAYFSFDEFISEWEFFH